MGQKQHKESEFFKTRQALGYYEYHHRDLIDIFSARPFDNRTTLTGQTKLQLNM